MFSHVSTFSELPFEKAHKHLKRFVARSSMKHLQTYVSKQVRVRDWRSRLVTALSNYPDDDHDLRADYCAEASRFLCSSEEDTKYKPKIITFANVQELLGPDNCIMDFLLEQARPITGINPERAPYRWSLGAPFIKVHHGTWDHDPPADVVATDWPTVLRTIGADVTPAKAVFSDHAIGIAVFGKSRRNLFRGDVGSLFRGYAFDREQIPVHGDPSIVLFRGFFQLPQVNQNNIWATYTVALWQPPMVRNLRVSGSITYAICLDDISVDKLLFLPFCHAHNCNPHESGLFIDHSVACTNGDTYMFYCLGPLDGYPHRAS